MKPHAEYRVLTYVGAITGALALLLQLGLGKIVALMALALLVGIAIGIWTGWWLRAGRR